MKFEIDCPVVSDEKMFKECGRRRTMEAYLSYKLTKWAFGSGELKKTQWCKFSFKWMVIFVRHLMKHGGKHNVV